MSHVETRHHELDLEAALARAQGDEALLHEAVMLCMETLPEHVAAVEAARGSDDFRDLVMAAHSLKGMIANFATEGLTEEAHCLEEAARQGDMSRADESWLRLSHRLEELSREIASLVAEVG